MRATTASEAVSAIATRPGPVERAWGTVGCAQELLACLLAMTDCRALYCVQVRREKISERMKFLQDLVPGCSKVSIHHGN